MEETMKPIEQKVLDQQKQQKLPKYGLSIWYLFERSHVLTVNCIKNRHG